MHHDRDLEDIRVRTHARVHGCSRGHDPALIVFVFMPVLVNVFVKLAQVLGCLRESVRQRDRVDANLRECVPDCVDAHVRDHGWKCS